jgi:hypothetical protein
MESLSFDIDNSLIEKAIYMMLGSKAPGFVA